MNKSFNKTAIALIGILVFSLVAGNILFAGEESGSGGGLVNSDDVAFISGNWSSGNTSGFQASNSSWEVIPAEDVEFAASPFNRALLVAGSSDKGSSQNVVNAADINFVRTGGSDANLVCVIDGVQVTGKACIN